MKPVMKIFDILRPLFDEGGKMKPLRCVFDAAENFFFFHNEPTEGAPHLRDPLDIKRFMGMAIIAIAPAALAGVYFFGLRVLAMIAVSYAVGGSIEAAFAIIRKEEITEGFLVTGLIFPLILPPGLPLWMVAVGVAFGVIVGKELFGGTGRNLFNPALLGRAFLFLGYPAAMARDYWMEPGTGPVGRLIQFAGAVDAETVATPLSEAREAIFADTGALMWGNVSGSVGETSALLIAAGGIFLIATRIANWRTVAATLGSFTLLGLFINHLTPADFGPIGWHLLAGGLLFGTFFMATDPVTSPVSDGGKWAYGILIGISTLLIRNLTGWMEGVMFAILLGNIAAPVMDEVALRLRQKRLIKIKLKNWENAVEE